jgi:hypothetical protein
MSYYSSDFSQKQENTQFNGRIDISKPSSLQIPSFYKKQQTNNKLFYAEAVQGNFTPNNLSNTFFSCNNIDVLQDGIRYKIYKLTNEKHIIGRQSDQDLKIVMRSIYLQHSKNLNTDIIQQVKDLNTLVLDWCVKEIFSNIQQYDKYCIDVSTLPTPIERSQLMTNKGSKILEVKTFV